MDINIDIKNKYNIEYGDVVVTIFGDYYLVTENDLDPYDANIKVILVDLINSSSTNLESISDIEANYNIARIIKKDNLLLKEK